MRKFYSKLPGKSVDFIYFEFTISTKTRYWKGWLYNSILPLTDRRQNAYDIGLYFPVRQKLLSVYTVYWHNSSHWSD